MARHNVGAHIRKDGTKVRAHTRQSNTAARSDKPDAAATARRQALAAEAENLRTIYDDGPLYPELSAAIDDLRADVESRSEGTVAEIDYAVRELIPEDISWVNPADWRDYYIHRDASDEMTTLSSILKGDDTPETVDAVTVLAAERAISLEAESSRDDARIPSPDLTAARQILTGVAAHPNASREAVLLAVRCEGKYAAREAVKRDDPEIVEAAFELGDVNSWHAVDEDGNVNPALAAHRLEPLIDIIQDGSSSNDTDDLAWHRRIAKSLSEHPNITNNQRARARPLFNGTPLDEPF